MAAFRYLFLALAAALVVSPPAGAAAPSIVLIAGDGSLPVFDNAVGAMDARLQEFGGGAATTRRLSGSDAMFHQYHLHAATLDHVLQAVSTMKPAPGQGCLVFATSHGVKGEGMYLSLRDEVLTPMALDRALLRGCGGAPTVVVISSCFSGSFTRPPMNRANRIILTAARPDRTSFGCQAGRVYTVFDQCLLVALDRQTGWRTVFGATTDCVSAEERRQDVQPSEPQAWFGAEVADSLVPARAGAR